MKWYTPGHNSCRSIFTKSQNFWLSGCVSDDNQLTPDASSLDIVPQFEAVFISENNSTQIREVSYQVLHSIRIWECAKVRRIQRMSPPVQ
ncbi:hypothetical protein TNCV_1581741 [Trichonephila clavipes]|nr:hypothetical protein TNCV_1581741 [Trichonephila clavipes]